MQADYVRRSFVAITNVWHKGLEHPEVTMDGCEAEAGLNTSTDGRRPKLHGTGFGHGPWPTIPWDSVDLSALGILSLLFPRRLRTSSHVIKGLKRLRDEDSETHNNVVVSRLSRNPATMAHTARAVVPMAQAGTSIPEICSCSETDTHDPRACSSWQTVLCSARLGLNPRARHAVKGHPGSARSHPRARSFTASHLFSGWVAQPLELAHAECIGLRH